jgi:hypothetical protein
VLQRRTLWCNATQCSVGRRIRLPPGVRPQELAAESGDVAERVRVTAGHHQKRMAAALRIAPMMDGTGYHAA